MRWEKNEWYTMSLGLNFRIAPEAVLVMNIITAVESAANELNYQRKKHRSSERK